MNEVEIYGDFKLVSATKKQEFLQINFSPSSVSIQQRWRNNGLSADFAADYLTTFFPAVSDSSSARRKQAEIKSAVSYVANELLENAMKFNYTDYPIQFGMHLLNEPEVTVILYTTNSLSETAMNKFKQFIQTLSESDPAELYLQQLERSAESEADTVSMVGILTMITDHAAKLGWKFEPAPEDPAILMVTTMVQLAV
ncbi:slr1658 superfamily regulator [Leptolyngbya sp. 7M]|uniref:slr1658 superfamily regulator n=1 Tax=Leptolyngbya sp. 7M TaxID=2812896 RepID=UPI001B8AF14B|nr:ATP-binding protein [Leptolyngbya sp. 7M]QYO68184.1 ATP-binding protein [Leptolyngbya sp. 7M]